MSWASIARNIDKSNARSTPQLLVQYNIPSASSLSNNEVTDHIPRHREKTPHPADDFIMTNCSDLIANKTVNDKKKGMVDHWTYLNG